MWLGRGFQNEEREREWNKFKKKKKKKEEETEELCDWVVGFKMRTEREWNRFKKRKKKQKKKEELWLCRGFQNEGEKKRERGREEDWGLGFKKSKK